MSSFLILSISPSALAVYPDQLNPAVEVELPSPIGGAAALYPTATAPDSVVVPQQDGALVRIDSEGKILWSTRLGESISSCVAVGELDGSGSPECLAISDLSLLHAVSTEGRLLWSYELPGEVGGWRGPSIADLDQDGKGEVIASDDAGWITCLSSEGKLLWRVHADNYRAGQASAADVDGDGLLELVYGTENNRLICLDHTGQVQWLLPVKGKFGRTYVTLADLSGDGLPEALWTKSFNDPISLIYAADASTGKPLWQARTELHGYGSISIGDLNHDGAHEIVFGDRANTVYALDTTGKEIWRTTTGGRGYQYPATLADADGDGKVEVLAVCRDRNDEGFSFFVLDGEKGAILARYPLGGRAAVPPLIADLGRDGTLETIFAIPDQKKVGFYRFGGTDESVVPWPMKRYDSARTGALPASTSRPAAVQPQVPASHLDLEIPDSILLGTNSVKCGYAAAPPAKGCYEVSVMDSSGVRSTYFHNFDAESFPSTLPVALGDPAQNTVTITLWDETSAPALPLARGSIKITPGDLAGFRASVEEDLESVRLIARNISSTKLESARMLLEKAASYSGAMESLTGTSTANSEWVHQLDELRERVRRLTNLARFAQGSPFSSIAVWEDRNPWDENDPRDAIPEVLAATTEIEVWSCQGEVEHRVLCVANLSPNPIDAQIRIPRGEGITLREEVLIPRKDGTWVPDALPRMSESHTIHLAPGEIRRVWIEIRTDPGHPGVRSANITVLPLGFDEDRPLVSLRFDTQPIQLADAPEFAICAWANPQSLLTMTEDESVIPRALEQGMTVWTTSSPNRRIDAAGNLVGEVDWRPLDRVLDLLDPRTAHLLFYGPSFTAPPELSPESPEYQKGLSAALREFAAFMARKGWPLDRWAFYPMDEPGLFGEVERFRELVEKYQRAAPEIQIYANPAGGVRQEDFQPVVEEIDIWSPELALLRRDPDLAEFFRSTGDLLWCYEAPGEVKTLLPLGYHRAQCLTAFWMGFTGAGHWVYAYPGVDDLWLKQAGAEYGDMYYYGHTFVDSRRWLAFLDGAEDARFLLLLKDLISNCQERGLDTPELTEAEELVGPRLKHLIRKQWDHDDIARFVVDYELDLEGVSQIRRDAARLTLALQQQLIEEPPTHK